MQETKKCLNCGYDAHEGKLYRTETDYDGNTYQIEVCPHSRIENINE
jgi:hypothetical protein